MLGARGTTGSCARRSACCAARSSGSTVRRAASSRSSSRGSCFAGSLLELALAADRTYMLAPREATTTRRAIALAAPNFGLLPDVNGLTRLASRFCGEPERVARRARASRRAARRRGGARARPRDFAPDEIDWDDEIRLALEERASLSPDALTGMEANLRFAGPETMETKIFGRLSAWQNWIFNRPNAVGERGALKLYGSRHASREFDWERV